MAKVITLLIAINQISQIAASCSILPLPKIVRHFNQLQNLNEASIFSGLAVAISGEIANSVDPDQTAPWSSLIRVYTFCSSPSAPAVRVGRVDLNLKGSNSFLH